MEDRLTKNLIKLLVIVAVFYYIGLVVLFAISLSGCKKTPDILAPRLITESKVSVLAFVASWCEPCQKAKSILIAMRFNKGLNVFFIDIDKLPEMAESCRITSVPTFFVYVKGKRTTRTQDISVVVRIVKENMK